MAEGRQGMPTQDRRYRPGIRLGRRPLPEGKSVARRVVQGGGLVSTCGRRAPFVGEVKPDANWIRGSRIIP